MEEQEVVLLSFSLCELRDWRTGTGRVTSEHPGTSGISKGISDQNKPKTLKRRSETGNFTPEAPQHTYCTITCHVNGV